MQLFENLKQGVINGDLARALELARKAL